MLAANEPETVMGALEGLGFEQFKVAQACQLRRYEVKHRYGIRKNVE